MTRYILIPQRQGKTQRITLPMELLRKKEWLSADCYLLVDKAKDEVTLKQYLFDATGIDLKPGCPNLSGDKLSEDKDDD